MRAIPRPSAWLAIPLLVGLPACHFSWVPPVTPPAMTPSVNGWFHVEQRPWFTVEMPSAPRVTHPKLHVPLFAEAQAEQLEAGRGRQAFVVYAIYSRGGWDVDGSKLVDEVVADSAKTRPIRSIHRSAKGDGADYTSEGTEKGIPFESRTLIVVSNHLVLMLNVVTPKDRTADEAAAESYFMHSVGDAPS